MSRSFPVFLRQVSRSLSCNIQIINTYVLFTDASKCAWVCLLTWPYEHKTVQKKVINLHPIIYMSGLLHGSQMNRASLTKEA